ncbi:hypothetical protein BpHYR1_025580 [Brachionus plicatilis]|uniref:Ig-like domain-containing protein n=1 Tax=Brachionus plicatilis TaxID=10195 RepID=A0A3M7S4Q1_BRAPC|nr:hypothetical protein BpHYR1_025580 [Brachionus plicatilis]
MMRVNSSIFWFMISIVLFMVKNECSKQGEYKFLLNKSYNIFIDNGLSINRSRNDLIRSNQFRLKCDLTVDKNSNKTSEREESMNQNYQIKWFKLDPHKLLILHDYAKYQLDELNDQLMSDLSIYPIETDLSDEHKFSLSSNLIFNYRYQRDSLLKMNGVYLCKLSPKSNQTSLPKSIFFQSVQQVSVNVLNLNKKHNFINFYLNFDNVIKSMIMNFKLPYSLIIIDLSFSFYLYYLLYGTVNIDIKTNSEYKCSSGTNIVIHNFGVELCLLPNLLKLNLCF